MACKTNELMKWGINSTITSNNNRGQFRLLFSNKKGAIIRGMYSPQNSGLGIISGAVQGGGYFKFCSLDSVVP